MVRVAEIGFRVGITKNRQHIVVQDSGTSKIEYLTAENWTGFYTEIQEWAVLQSMILTSAKTLGWSL
jgi:hypothetical protein